MSKLLRYEAKRLIRSKSFWISLFAAVIFAIQSWWYRWEIFTPDFVEEQCDVLGRGSDVCLICVLFASVFFASEFSQGTIKNVISKGYTKAQVYLSKFLLCCVAVIAISLVVTALNISVACYLGLLTCGFWICHCFVRLLLFLALTSLATFITMTIQNVTAAVIVNLVHFYVLPDLLSILVSERVSGYMLPPVSGSFDGRSPPEALLRPMVVCILWIVVTLAGGLAIFKRRDVC
ncbi:MAG: ABC transporter permease [Oscillospiraceae bacterium]|jgi:ABC-2 type transport system permease protein|nr:ABC transporter permease [Oscillospiraceae bacterium]